MNPPTPTEPRSRFMRGDINLALLVPLLIHVTLMQMTVVMVRVTTSYRAIELELPVIWLGIISAGFAMLPIVAAVPLGRYIDRGNDSRAVWMGAVLILIGCFGIWAWPDSALHLFAFSVIMGLGHTCTIAAQQTMIVRCAGAQQPRGRVRQLRGRGVGRAVARAVHARLARRSGAGAADRPAVPLRPDRRRGLPGAVLVAAPGAARGRTRTGRRSHSAGKAAAAARIAGDDVGERRDRHRARPAGDLSAAAWHRARHRRRPCRRAAHGTLAVGAGGAHILRAHPALRRPPARLH